MQITPWVVICRPPSALQTSETLKRKTPADGEGLSFGRTRRIVSSALTSRALTPLGRRPLRSGDQNAPVVAFCRTAVVGLLRPSLQTKNPPPMARVSRLVGPGGLSRARLLCALSPLWGAAAALWRPKCACSRILSNRCPSVSSGLAFKRKTPADGEGFTFGRTRRIRTADLYHVKANRPHQDIRGN